VHGIFPFAFVSIVLWEQICEFLSRIITETKVSKSILSGCISPPIVVKMNGEPWPNEGGPVSGYRCLPVPLDLRCRLCVCHGRLRPAYHPPLFGHLFGCFHLVMFANF
jgi:hypothetical protein